MVPATFGAVIAPVAVIAPFACVAPLIVRVGVVIVTELDAAISSVWQLICTSGALITTAAGEWIVMPAAEN